MSTLHKDDTVRLAKRLSEMLPCSRREAELYILGGWVSVDGELVEEAGVRVAPEQTIVLSPQATLAEIAPVTLLLHKPVGFSAGHDGGGKLAQACLIPEALMAQQGGQESSAQPRFLKHHLTNLTLTNALASDASGLVIFTQDFRVARKLVDEQDRVEQEFIVEVAGAIVAGGLTLLNHGLPFNGKPLAPINVSWQNETRLRFALKGVQPGQIVHMCKMVGLSVVGMKRLRIGRISMATLPVGQWRYLLGYERF
jgi:23S rRNA pseudouridine2604 synthase